MKILNKKAPGTDWTWRELLSNPLLWIMKRPAPTITLDLDKQSAIDLRDLIYGFGEHVAAGSELPKFDSAANSRLGAIYGSLENQLKKTND